jgi:RimJ/RimL family protein N-acetyltransferase
MRAAIPLHIEPMSVEYPIEYASSHELPGGERLDLRPIRPTDGPGLLDLYERLSPESLYARFLAYPTPEPTLVDYLTHVDYRDHFALVGEIDGRIVAVGRFVRDDGDPTRAEPAIVVADSYQGRHIGTVVLDRIGRIALDLGIHIFEFDVLGENARVLSLVDELGPRVTRRVDGEVMHVEVSLDE